MEASGISGLRLRVLGLALGIFWVGFAFWGLMAFGLLELRVSGLEDIQRQSLREQCGHNPQSWSRSSTSNAAAVAVAAAVRKSRPCARSATSSCSDWKCFWAAEEGCRASGLRASGSVFALKCPGFGMYFWGE